MIFFLRIRRPPKSPLFPDTTLFRSGTGLFDTLLEPLVDERTARRMLGNEAIADRPLGDLLRERFDDPDRKSTRLNSSHANISYAVFCLKKKYGRYIGVWSPLVHVNT